MPPAAAQRHHPRRNAKGDEVPAAPGQYCQIHRYGYVRVLLQNKSWWFSVTLLTELFFFLTENGEEREKVTRAGECCKKILNHVNQAVKEAENKQVGSP